MTRHLSLILAFLLHSCRDKFVQSLMSSSHVLRCLPLALLPSILPSNMCLQMLSCRFMCPKYWSFLLLIVFRSVCWTFNIAHTSLLVFFSVQLILSIRLRTHISKASIFFSSFLFRVHVSDPRKLHRSFLVSEKLANCSVVLLLLCWVLRPTPARWRLHWRRGLTTTRG